MRSSFETHEVFNQSPPLEDVNLFAADRPLVEAVAANGAGSAAAELSEFGLLWGSAVMMARGREANVSLPRLAAFDPRGFRRDAVEFHPAYHELMAESTRAGLHNGTWTAAGARAGAPAEVVRAAKFYMAAQIECGHLCPITMTRAAIAPITREPALLAEVMPRVAARAYDPDFRPWRDKRGMTIGMGMTEKQGGTDVRANSTRATRDGGAYRLTGHKWFMSAPMCDAFLVLARAEGGLTCFFMPRFEPDGRVNGLRVQRLKDKLGNRSNASSEVEFVEAHAVRVGEEGRGVPTIIDMVQLTRLDCALASAGLMRVGLAQALNHTRYRSVFQKHLADQPLMRSVLADMALQVEATTALVMRLARAFDLAASDPREAIRARVLTPAVKYWVCKAAPGFLHEAMECLGGNGYTEDGPLARHYREAPVNAIWEGSGNVMCLDVLRAIAREGEATRTLIGELAGEARGLPGVESTVARIGASLTRPTAEAGARACVELVAALAATAALNATAPAIAEAFARTRLAEPRGQFYGAADIADATARLLTDRALAPA